MAGTMTTQLPDLENECFFISPIGPEGSDVRARSDGVMNYIVADAARDLGLQVVRGDQIAQPGVITHQVIEHVLGARAAVADLTGRNPNVYYELAVRHTAKLPVALIAEDTEQLPFDIAQMRTIFFRFTDLGSAANCRAAIVDQLRSAFDGAVESPITTTLDLQSLRSGNLIERTVGEIATRLEEVAAGTNDLRTAIAALGRRTAARGQASKPFFDLILKLNRTGSLTRDEISKLIHEGVNQGYWEVQSQQKPQPTSVRSNTSKARPIDPDEDIPPPPPDVDPDDIPF
jgi:hypothetical protein